MEETPSVQSEERPAPPRKPRGPSGSVLLSFVVGLVAAGSLGTSAWVYRETQQQMASVASDIAQFRIALELFGRQQGATPQPASDNAGLSDLTNRLSILEENWRNAPAPVATVAAPAAATPSTAEASGDCMPTGTRFMITAGDSYPVCGFPATVEIGNVDSGFVTLRDGTVIASGGNIGLPGSKCMIGVVDASEGGITGFADIRVSC